MALGTLAGLLLAAGTAHAGSTFTVNDAGDEPDTDLAGICDTSADPGNQCTLRAAIQESNFLAGSNEITFDIPGGSTATIAPETLLPDITASLAIDGYTQPGAQMNTARLGKPLDTKIRVFIDGSGVAPDYPSAGLEFTAGAGGSVVEGLAIGSFPGPGVFASAPITVRGSFLGTDQRGRDALPNTEGFFGFGGDGSVIGGDTAAERNLISANGFGGVVSNPAVIVRGNYIGTQRDGTSPLGNGVGHDRGGVLIYATGASNEVVNNVIAHNESLGIALQNSGPGSLFRGNRMFGNGGLGIDLYGDGVTPNDNLDADSGPNGLQNFPVIAKATRQHGKTKVLVRLDSEPDTSYEIDVYEADGNTRQGKRLVGGKSLTTDENGSGSRVLKVRKPKKGQRVIATATNPALGTSGATSEFSKPRKVK